MNNSQLNIAFDIIDSFAKLEWAEMEKYATDAGAVDYIEDYTHAHNVTIEPQNFEYFFYNQSHSTVETILNQILQTVIDNR